MQNLSWQEKDRGRICAPDFFLLSRAVSHHPCVWGDRNRARNRSQPPQSSRQGLARYSLSSREFSLNSQSMAVPFSIGIRRLSRAGKRHSVSLNFTIPAPVKAPSPPHSAAASAVSRRR